MAAAACVIGLLVGPSVPAAAPQTAAEPAPEKTFGAPPGLRDVAVEIDRLLTKERKFADARAMCEQAYRSATEEEVRAFFLRGIAETEKMQGRLDLAIELFKQVIAQFPQTQQISWAKFGDDIRCIEASGEGDAVIRWEDPDNIENWIEPIRHYVPRRLNPKQ